MKKRILSLVLVLAMLVSISAYAKKDTLKDGNYVVPIRLMQYYEAENESMGAKALSEDAYVQVKDAKATITFYTSRMEFTGAEGSLINRIARLRMRGPGAARPRNFNMSSCGTSGLSPMRKSTGRIR